MCRLQRVLFVSQRQAEAMRPPRLAVLISITDSHRADASLGAGWGDLLRLKFDDVDPVTFPGQDTHLQAISTEQLAQIAAFVATHRHRCQRLVVHCRHGISRSAAVAKAVADALGLPFPLAYNEYNRFVHQAVRRVLLQAVVDGGAGS